MDFELFFNLNENSFRIYKFSIFPFEYHARLLSHVK